MASGFNDVETAAVLWRPGRGDGGAAEINETGPEQLLSDGRPPLRHGIIEDRRVELQPLLWSLPQVARESRLFSPLTVAVCECDSDCHLGITL